MAQRYSLSILQAGLLTPPLPFVPGARVRLRHVEHAGWTSGTITQASSNGKAIAVMLEDGVPAGAGWLFGVLRLLLTADSAATAIGLPGDEYEIGAER